jgi:hypothetical protein
MIRTRHEAETAVALQWDNGEQKQTDIKIISGETIGEGRAVQNNNKHYN